MKKKKGFTLIELLAVIVILAIIALIVTPVVSNIVSNANNAANARSVEGHIKNIEYAIISKAFEDSTGDMTTYDTGKTAEQIEELVTADNDNVTCESYKIQNGTVISALGCKDKEDEWSKTYNYSNIEGAFVFEFKGTVILPGLDSNNQPTKNVISSTIEEAMADSSGERIVTYLGIVYMDPANLKTVCDQSSTITTTVTGCKKFYIYKDNGTTYKMIMDRNTTTKIAWVSKVDYNNDTEFGTYGNTSKGALTAKTQLVLDTAGWIGSPDLISADEIAELVGASSTSTIAWSSTKPSGTTVATQSSWFYLDGMYNNTSNEPGPKTYSSSDGWQKQYANSTTKSNYAWLYDYTKTCTSYGCNIALASTNGYWTKTKHYNQINIAWCINESGKLSNQYVSTKNQFGIRPVLEVPKSLLGL